MRNSKNHSGIAHGSYLDVSKSGNSVFIKTISSSYTFSLDFRIEADHGNFGSIFRFAPNDISTFKINGTKKIGDTLTLQRETLDSYGDSTGMWGSKYGIQPIKVSWFSSNDTHKWDIIESKRHTHYENFV